ncbi:MAG: PH domain-containing protein [Cryobacterium sp.]
MALSNDTTTGLAGQPAPLDAGAPAEQVIARLRPHARVLMLPTLVLFGVCGAAGYFAGSFTEEWQNLALLAGAGGAVLLVWLLPLVFWLNRRYTLTSRRIIFRHGFFVHTRQELLHSRGHDVTLRQTWLQSAFRSGDVRINSGLEHPLVLKDVPSAALVQRALQDQMDSTRTVMAPRRHGQSAQGNDTAFWTER